MLNGQAMSQKPTSDVKHPPIRSYGRRWTKGLRNTRAEAMDRLLPLISIALPATPHPNLLPQGEKERSYSPSPPAGSTTPARVVDGRGEGGQIDPHSFFDAKVKEVWFEIGFGNGEHILHQAINNPEIGLIGCEPFMNGVAALCVGLDKNKVKNVRLWPDDARMLMGRIKPASLDRLFLLHPDPWPKTRHHKRRFIQTETLDEIARLLKPGAEFRMATDHAELATWLLEKTYFHPAFSWMATNANDWRTPPADWPETRYGQKGVKQGRPPVYFIFRRKPD
jgi:tRNA (guanine-N7-)-methyltransferase